MSNDVEKIKKEDNRMANLCEKCGKKVGAFSPTPLKLVYDQILCYECAEVISADITKLYGAKTIEDFNEIKAIITEKAKQNYDESICRMIDELIINILRESSYIGMDYLSTQEGSVNKKQFVDNYMLTTGYDFIGYKIKKYIGIVSGQIVLGTGFLSEFTASFSDFFGVQSEKFATKLEQAKQAALEKMVVKSDVKGGNAIIGVDFDYITFHGNMIGVIANGTSVVVEEEK